MGGKKFDQKKPPISLIPREALECEAQALAFGADKYGRYNFREGIAYSRLIDAALRHILAIADGEDMDEESQCFHAGNARANLGMLLYMMKHKPNMDDRWNAKPSPTFSEIAEAWKNIKIPEPSGLTETSSEVDHCVLAVTKHPDAFVLKNEVKVDDRRPRFERDRQNGFNVRRKE